ncbi:MAG TPA: GC-type dockerin domain-anchored protein [Phycisphaerales bacterium]|nr:GC-type dockerin domain-anchored protein [Phycisphaerales bacterium]
MVKVARFAPAFVLAAALGGVHSGAALAQEIQPAPLITEPMAVEVDSGLVRHEGEGEAVVFSRRIFIPGAAALRLEFDEVVLSGLVSDGSASYLRITSTLDGAQQRLNGLHVKQWGRTSAYFNGDEVIVEIVARGGTGDNLLRMSTVQAEFEPFVDRSICGATDDRELSDDNRTARLLPVGCTGWLIEDCNHCFLTAGHCSTSNNSITVVEFNVPLSNSNGSLNHPPPEDQYAPDIASRQSNSGGSGVGDDWAYFGVFPNSNTGLTPYEAYGDAFALSIPPQVTGQQIRITGYGTTSSPVPPQWNQVQKTHTGPYFSFSGTTVSYQTDTTGGNSGSPVIDDSTGMAIGIHTHGGCSGNSGNYGTGYNHSGLQTALASPRGVCECPLLTFHFPGGLPEQVDPAGGTTVTVEVLADGDVFPQPGTGIFYYDAGSGFVSVPMAEPQENVYIATFPAIDCGTTVRYYFSAETTGGEVVLEPRLAPNQSYAADSTLGYETVREDDFETDAGWTVGDAGDGATTGLWNRADPQPTDAQPGDDVSGDGTQCWVTDGRGGNIGDFDVDNGKTTLKTPVLDLAAEPDAVVSYWRWYSNDKGGDPQNDRFRVDVTNGGAWVNAETVGPTGSQAMGGWYFHQFRMSDFVSPSGTVQVRFVAEDAGSGSIIEAAIDEFRVFSFVCAEECVADFNGDGSVNTQDVLAFLNAWNAGEGSADINGDGTINTQDVLAFLNLWNAGC